TDKPWARDFRGDRDPAGDAVLCLRHDLWPAHGRLSADRGRRGLAVVWRLSAAAGLSHRRTSLDLAPDAGIGRSRGHHGDFLQRTRADDVLHVPCPARHPYHELAGLPAYSDRRRPVGAIAR